MRKNEINNEIIRFDMSSLNHDENTGNVWPKHAHMIRLKKLELGNEF